MDEGGVFPSLRKAAIVEKDITLLELQPGKNSKNDEARFGEKMTRFQNSPVGSILILHVDHKLKSSKTYLAELTLLGVLLDGVSYFVCGNLVLLSVMRKRRKW